MQKGAIAAGIAGVLTALVLGLWACYHIVRPRSKN